MIILSTDKTIRCMIKNILIFYFIIKSKQVTAVWVLDINDIEIIFENSKTPIHVIR